jgi:purine nucleosidase/pyrimidine-specific ribonucleoside hydrolase
MAVAYVIDPSMFKTQKHIVNIETRGELTRGMTIVERKHSERVNELPGTEIIVEVEAERFHSLILDRVT